MPTLTIFAVLGFVVGFVAQALFLIGQIIGWALIVLIGVGIAVACRGLDMLSGKRF